MLLLLYLFAPIVTSLRGLQQASELKNVQVKLGCGQQLRLSIARQQCVACRHLLSHKQNGIEIQTYSDNIACTLIALWTGRKPTKRTFEMNLFPLLRPCQRRRTDGSHRKAKKTDAMIRGVLSASHPPPFTLRA